MKKIRRILILSLSAVLCISGICVKGSKADRECSDVSAQAAVMLECSTNTVLYSKAADTKLPMASTTKVMTALVAIENGNLDSIVTTADEAYGVEGSSIYLSKNEQLSLRDLLYGLMLRSGNDAAVAIACYIGGSVPEFVEMMNNRVKQIGAQNTHFSNPNGLPSDTHYTTAYDLALICSAALKNETFKTIVSTQYHTATTGAVKRTMMNKNKLLWQYEGAIGIKTGYTQAAGKCLTFAAERNDMTVVGVVLNCPNMFPDSITLMDWCFNNYEMYTLVHAGTTVMRTQVEKSTKLLNVITESDVKVPVKKSDGIKLNTKICVSEKLIAPLCTGDIVGELYLYNSERQVASCKLICESNIVPENFMYYMRFMVNQFAS